MSELYFTKIRWAGSDCILITDNIATRRPVALLTEQDIKRLNKEFQDKVIIEK